MELATLAPPRSWLTRQSFWDFNAVPFHPVLTRRVALQGARMWVAQNVSKAKSGLFYTKGEFHKLKQCFARMDSRPMFAALADVPHHLQKRVKRLLQAYPLDNCRSALRCIRNAALGCQGQFFMCSILYCVTRSPWVHVDVKVSLFEKLTHCNGSNAICLDTP